jgi:signal transduction histidine kinase
VDAIARFVGSVDYSLVEATPGAGGAVPPSVQLSAYRVVQESLANVRRHSTAHRASVVVRVGEHIEVEVLDDGSPRVGTSGTGLGLQGIRERVQHLGGDADIGPRHGAGFRVRVRFPLTSSAAARVAK